jgi:Bacterial Ig domain
MPPKSDVRRDFIGAMVMNGRLVAAVLVAASAFVQVLPAEAACSIPSWRFRWGPAPTPVTFNITEGSTCGSTISLRGAEKLTGVGVVSNASNGTVRTTGNRFEYRPKAGFKGADRFAVELRGTDSWGAPVTNRLDVSVSIQ